MKKQIAGILAVLLLLNCAACGGSKASVTATAVGAQAVGILDEYLDGSKSYVAACVVVDSLYAQMEYAYDYEDLESPTAEQEADKAILFQLLYCKSILSADGFEIPPETYSTSAIIRNNIAEIIGVEARQFP